MMMMDALNDDNHNHDHDHDQPYLVHVSSSERSAW